MRDLKIEPDAPEQEALTSRAGEELERAVADYDKAKRRVGATVHAAIIAILLGVLVLILTVKRTPWTPFFNFLSPMASAILAVVAARWRKRSARELRGRLEALPPKTRRAVLAGLRDQKYPNRVEFVEALEKELATQPREMAPASPPEGTGSELTT